ncbi:uncharacterized protein LOC129753176 [Uranotaenia lowii]|uniref:uncharacterized protein LOC129753176 n=1 Tax=Uranotaenia lowii TaxID=190385 RepID=UPI00247A4025|nr:uncharacterized protein LOC129753176 [Uranotaenia lowii]
MLGTTEECAPIHVFTDASEAAYGCVAYLRVVVDETVRCSLGMSRSKVSPIQQLSIPRNELQAAVLGARLADTVQKNHRLPITQRYFWTDSQTVLSWIRSDQRKYSQFVGHRIGEILSNTKLSEWRWVPTKSNVADLLTKWSVGSKLTDDSVWFVGPQFLYETEERWPSQRPPKANVSEELRAQFLYHDVFIPEPFIDVSRFSKWLVLQRTLACVLRFVSNCRKKRLNPRSVRDWIAIEKCSPLYKLTPLLDEEGLIRMEGRTEHGELLPFDMRFPIILPKEHLITAKLTHSYHEKYGHGYRDTVKNELKQRFWIPNVGAVIRKVSKECVWCKVNHNRPQVPRMAPLPYQRVTPYLRPFSYVGVDYLGPVEVTVGRRTEKRWICLFTCLVIRAVHLEVAHSLTNESCLMAIRRFVGRRGPPREFLSDNGTNFKGAFKELQKQIRDINMECANETTTVLTGWKFNPPATPHMGGIWERLVRSVKEALFALHDGRRLTDEILQTSMIKAEDMINARPLTSVSGDVAEEEALSPNHFLRSSPTNEIDSVPPYPQDAVSLRNSYQRSQQLAYKMWDRWIKEYVPSLNPRSKWHDETNPVQKGDLVYIVEGTNRKCWVRGIVDEPVVSADGRIRQAWIRTNDGRLKRGVAKLAVLEISSGKTEPEVTSGPDLRVGDMLGTTEECAPLDKVG